MTLTVYAVADGTASVADGVGIDGAPLEGVSDGYLTAVVTDNCGALAEPDMVDDRVAGEPDPDLLWEYERVIESLMDHHAIVPVRYGSRLPNRAEVRSMLSHRRDELTAALERVRGTVEVSIDARYPREASTDPPQDGRAYMYARLEQHRRTDALSQQLNSLSAHARASRIRPLRPPAVGVHAAYLIPTADVPEFTERVSELGSRLDDVDLVCTGPWPPYSFVEGAAG
jgi:hypothetical protein